MASRSTTAGAEALKTWWNPAGYSDRYHEELLW
jgi:hypothetical protein